PGGTRGPSEADRSRAGRTAPAVLHVLNGLRRKMNKKSFFREVTDRPPLHGAEAMATKPLNRVILHLRQAALLHSSGGLTDGGWLDCYVSRRDQGAFEALVRRHGPMVLGVCRRILRNEADAEDAFHFLSPESGAGKPGCDGGWITESPFQAEFAPIR